MGGLLGGYGRKDDVMLKKVGDMTGRLPPVLSLAEFEREATRRCFASKFSALTLDRLDEPGKEFEFLVDGLLSVADKSVIGGASRAGKSFLATHLAMCIAHAREFFGRKTKQGLVIYQCGEGRRGFKKRLRAWRQYHEIAFSRDTPFVYLQSAIDIYRPDGDTAALIAEIKGIAAQFDLPLAAFFIDTLATAQGAADENSGKDMGAVMANVSRINEETGAHVCLVHHMNAGGTKIRGHTSVYGNVDQVLLVVNNPNTGVRTVTLDKQKDDADGDKFQFELMQINLGEEPGGRAITSCVCLPVGEKEAVRRSEEIKGAQLRDDEGIAMRAFFEADKMHGRPVPRDMANMPRETRTIVDLDEVKKVWARTQPRDEMPAETATAEEIAAAKLRHRETLKKRWKRLREKLATYRVAGFGEDPSTKREVMWWAGRPLRGFPQTHPQMPAEQEAPPIEGLSEIPF